MDFLVLGGVVLVLTVLVYILATLGTKETPFEEAIAEQRQKRDQESSQTKTDKQHKKQKVKKVKGKKEDLDEVGGTAVQEVEVESEPLPEPTPPQPAEPEPSPQPIQEKKKEKKKKKEKERDVEEAPQKIVEEVQEIITMKTESVKAEAAPEPTPSLPVKLEVKEVKEEKNIKEVKEAVEAPVIAVQVDVTEAVDAPVAPVKKPTSPQEKKKKKEKQKNDVTTLSESKLLPMVQRAPLSGTEIQTLIDVLLNKQQQNSAGGDWVKKGKVDPITQLKRQLEELENRLRDKDEAHSALTAKITDLCSDLHGERSKSSKLKVQLDESAANHTRQQEAAAASAQAAQAARLNELRTALEQEYQAKLQQQQQLVEQLQSASNESEVTALRASLSDAEIQTKMLRQEHEELTQRCQQYEEHISTLEEKRAAEEAARSAQLSELQAQLQSADAARAQALSEIAAMDAERNALNGQLASDNAKYAQLQHKLQETLHEKAEVDSRLIQVESELRSVRQVVLDQNTRIERLKEEKESLASQSVRPAAEGQENGDVHAEQTLASDTAHLVSLVKEKEILIEEQLSEVVNLRKEISRLKEDLESQRAKNNEASGEVEEEKAKVRAVLRRIFPEVVVDDALALPVRKKTYQDQGAFLSEFESKALQVATKTVQQPKPEVVEKVVEIVKVVEKEVEVKVQDPALKSQVEELSKENAELRTRVAGLQKASTPSIDDSQRVTELEEEVRTVSEKVTHYQTVLADTENLLKSLQASVESEEVAWNKRLSEKEKDVRQLTADKANLQLQVKQLEDTLDKVKQAEDAAAEICGMEFALTCIEKSLPHVVTKMQAQLQVLQQQLQKEEKEKASLLEQLQNAQEQLTKTATQGSSGSDEASLLELKADNDKLRTLVSVGQDASRQQEQLIEQLQEELASVKAALAASRVSKMGYMAGWLGRNSNNTTTINNNNSMEQQTASTNGPANEEQCQEDDTSRADTASLMSASSASVTDTNTTQVQSGVSAKKAKKKKKGFFRKLIGKSTDP
ncbi:ribosome-binding protein 1 isoform X5 [Cherax quadricarinatus]|uniref:ribosome-binding protein 1 isoform X5 n=1 Tax=Cherax quadricarinatus TaxID=27406 RepID=UPI00387E970A